MSEELKVSNNEELLDASLKLLQDRKEASKALKDIASRVITASGGDKSSWSSVRKLHAKKGDGWVGNNPLVLDKDAKSKDILSTMFARLQKTIVDIESYNQADMLNEYFNALKESGITIELDHSKFFHADTTQLDVEDELDSSKAYIKTIESYDEEMKEVHATTSEALNFTAKEDYKKVLGLYNRKVKGKDIGDTVQDILTKHTMMDTAVNLINDMESVEESEE